MIFGEFLSSYSQEQLSSFTFKGEDLGLHSPGGQALEGGEPIQAFKEDEVCSASFYTLLKNCL